MVVHAGEKPDPIIFTPMIDIAKEKAFRVLDMVSVAVMPSVSMQHLLLAIV
jgi:hypothetical protein